MTSIPIRELGKIGVITDLNESDIPIEAVSDARNVRFSDGRITNAHVWRSALTSLGGVTPVFLFAGDNADSTDTLGYVGKNGTVYHVSNGTETNVSPTGYTPTDSLAPRSFCRLQNVYYVNQEDRVPWYFSSTSTKYATLTNWDTNHRCKVLRAYKDFLIALNVTKSSSVYPNMVKWSDIALYDAVPSSWDPADPTKSAGENTLAEIQTEILDGMQLRNSFIIYAADQAWTMEYTQGQDVFQFSKLYSNRGIVNTNCVVEVDGVHMVFDANDIYIHDGVSPPKSICDKRVRKRIFRFMDLSKRNVNFAYLDKAASEVWFCYNSLNPSMKWKGEDCTYCNTAAVYNYEGDTWTFFDLPNLSSMVAVSWQITQTYAASASAYDSVGSTYIDLNTNIIKSTFASSIVQSSVGITATRLLNADSGIGISQGFPSISELSVTPFVQRLGLDLDDVVPDLKAYKNYRCIVPQMKTESPVTLNFKFGGADYPQQDVEWDSVQSFVPSTDYKVDTRSRGRYLSWYFEGANVNGYSLSGFDLDMVSVSRR